MYSDVMLLTVLFIPSLLAAARLQDAALVDQEPMGEEGTTWDISGYEYSGLSSNATLKTYVRSESVKIWGKLNGLEVDDVLLVDGPPGIGKSTVLYGWARYKATESKVLWVHRGYGIKGTTLLDLHGKKFEVIQNTDMAETLLAMHRETTFDFIVLDGFRGQDHKAALELVVPIRNIVAVSCNSFSSAAHLKTSDEQEIREVYGKSLSTFRMESWTFSQYHSALTRNALSGIKALEDLKRAYYYAGGSIRLLPLDEEKVTKILNRNLSKVRDYSALLGGLSGDAGTDSVNTLMQYFDNSSEKSIPLSNYVVRKLAEFVQLSFVATAKNICQDNPSFQGWIFELEVLTMLKEGKLVYADGMLADWQVDLDPSKFKLRYFHDVADIEHETLENNSWLIPRKYNFGCIDLMFYRGKGEVFPVQITAAAKHEYKLDVIAPIVKTLKNDKGKCTVRFIVIIPVAKTEEFAISTLHFKSKHLIQKYDAEWSNSSVESMVWSLQGVCLSNSGIKVEKTSTGSSSVTTRSSKRARVDEEELFEDETVEGK
jgi:DNA polymerase III delta prime subunit